MGLFHFLRSKKFEQLFEKELETYTDPKEKDEIYDEIASNYLTILDLLKLKSFHTFRFPDHEDCRKISVDGREYDLDDAFRHNNRRATEALCAIDCLIADVEGSFESKLREIGKRVDTERYKR